MRACASSRTGRELAQRVGVGLRRNVDLELDQALKDESKPTGVRVRELIEPLGFDGGQSIVDDYLREVRPLFLKLRTHQRTVYRPGEIYQWDLWEPSSPVPVGHGQVRRAWGWSRVWATRALARAR